MRISRKLLADGRKVLAKRAIARAVQSIETLESRVLLAAQMTNTFLFASPNPATAGQTVSLQATVLGTGGGTPNDGTVTFIDDDTSNVIGTAPVTAGSAQLTSVTTLPVGTDNIEADYTPGDATVFSASKSTPTAVTINAASSGTTTSTTTVTSSSGGSSTVGQSVTFTATVTAGATGTVDFSSNGSAIGSGAINPATNQAKVTTTALAQGGDNIVASYEGDSTFASSQGSFTENVTASSGTTATTTTLGTSNGSVTVGTPITLTAVVNNVAATGTVDFTSGITDLGSAPVTNGVATLSGLMLGVGNYTIVATYSGDTNYAGSVSNPPLPETVSSVPLTSTTTSIGTSAATIQAGNPVTFTATVAPAAATGFVDFFSSGGTPTDLSGPVTVTNGVATFTTSALAAGGYNIYAVYTPSVASTYASSTSSTIAETVNPAPGTTMTTLNVTSLNPGVGTTETLTASVLPTTVTGTVTFFDGTTQLGSPVPVAGGSASLSIANFILGNHTLTATYNGDSTDLASTSPPVTITVVQGTPVLTVATSSPTITYGGTVTFTATVGPAAVGGILPTGTVTFLENGNPLSGAVNLVNGVATFATNTLTGGTDNISFTYSGDGNYANGTSSTVVQTVNPTTSSVALTAAPSPGVFGQSVTLTATVKSPTATGTVEFFDGTTAISGQVTMVGNVATFTTTALPTGSNTLTAVYSGDTNYLSSTSPIITEVIGQAPSSVSLTSSSPTVLFGNPVTLDASVPNAGATGTVSFYYGINLLGTSTLTAGNATLNVTTLPVGTDSITAVYSGDTNYLTSTSAPITETVTLAPTSTTLTATPTSLTQGQPIDITVTVTPVAVGSATPTGTVDILEGGTTTLISGVPLINGTAIISSTTVVLGTTTLSAVYSGDGNYNTSTSPGQSVTVSLPTVNSSMTAIASSASSITYGDSVTFTATVAPAVAGGVTPTGTVQFFYNNSVALGSPTTLVGGIATLTTSSLPPGTDNVIVVYSGDTYYTPSQSGEATETVAPTKGTYVTSLSVSPTAQFGNPVVFTATVTPADFTTPPAMNGTVTFFVGNQTIGAASVNTNGTAVFSTLLSPGTVTVTATYQSGGPSNTMSLPATVVVSSSATPNLGKAVVPSSVLAGMPFHATLPIVVTNLGHQQLKGNFTLDVYLDTSPTLDSNKMLLTNLPRTFALNGGKSKSFRLAESVAGVQSGVYYMVAEITDPNGLTNLTASKAISVTTPHVMPVATAIVISPPNIAIGGTASITVTVTNNGNETASGLLDLTLSPASGTGTPIPGIVLAQLTPSPTVTLQPGASRKFHIVFSAGSLAAGTYRPSVTVSLGGVSNTTVGTTPFVVGDLHNTIPSSKFP